MRNKYWTSLIVFSASVWPAGVVSAQDSAVPKKSPHTALDVRISPAIDLHYYVRSMVPKVEGQSIPASFERAVAAAGKLHEILRGGFLAWGLVDGTLVDCDTAAEIRESFGQLPETFKTRFPPPGKTIELRAPAVKLADALVEVEANFQSSVWPEHRRLLEDVEQRIKSELLPKQAECLAYMLDHLGMEDPQATIPVYLMVDAPFPGAFTFRTRGGGAVCLVSAKSGEGSVLFENVLHEATHALDIAAGNKSALAELRERLQKAGITRQDEALRDVPHTLMFVNAGETVRRLLNPEHVHYGDFAGYYAKVPRATAAIRPNWTKYLDGKITRDEALTAIVREFMASAPPN